MRVEFRVLSSGFTATADHEHDHEYVYEYNSEPRTLNPKLACSSIPSAVSHSALWILSCRGIAPSAGGP